MASLSIGNTAFRSPFDIAALPGKAKAQEATATQPSTGGSTNPFSNSNLGSTFLNLLVQELKNQDPTQPMDPTQSVGQLISLNQLDQLISINQTLNPAKPAASTPESPAKPSVTAVNGTGTLAQTATDLAANPALASQQAALAALQTAQVGNNNPAAPLNLNALTNLIGAR